MLFLSCLAFSFNVFALFHYLSLFYKFKGRGGYNALYSPGLCIRQCFPIVVLHKGKKKKGMITKQVTVLGNYKLNAIFIYLDIRL